MQIKLTNGERLELYDGGVVWMICVHVAYMGYKTRVDTIKRRGKMENTGHLFCGETQTPMKTIKTCREESVDFRIPFCFCKTTTTKNKI